MSTVRYFDPVALKWTDLWARDYALTRRPDEGLIHHINGCSYRAASDSPLLSIKCMFNGSARCTTGEGQRYVVDDSSYLILNHRNPYTVEKQSVTPMETFCLFFPAEMSGSVLRAMTSREDQLLSEPIREGTRPFNFLEHRYPHGDEVSSRISAIRSALAVADVEDDWLEERMLCLVASMIRLQRRVRKRIAGLPWAKASTRFELYRRIHIARDYMHAHLPGEFSLPAAAQAASLSSYHFLRSFKEILGMTPRDYVTRERIARAERLLLRTSKSISEIAATVGYESLPSFIKRFRSVKGCSPTEYRRASKYAIGDKTVKAASVRLSSIEVHRSRRMKLVRVCTAVIAVFGCCVMQLSSAQQQSAKEIDALEVVARRSAARNAHDIEAFLQTHAENVRILRFPDFLLAEQRAHIERIFRPAFERGEGSVETVGQSVIGDIVVTDEYVTGGSGTEHIVTIYRVDEGKIVEYWLIESD